MEEKEEEKEEEVPGHTVAFLGTNAAPTIHSADAGRCNAA